MVRDFNRDLQMQHLRAEHFGFFAVPAEDRDAGLREEIRGLLIDLWGAVGDRLPDGQRSRLGEIYAGPIKATQAGAWAQTRREQGQDAVNLTVEISAHQITINVVGGTKPQAAQLEAHLLPAQRPQEGPEARLAGGPLGLDSQLPSFGPCSQGILLAANRSRA